MFRRVVRLGSFPACWREAGVTPILKGPPSSSVTNYRRISITITITSQSPHKWRSTFKSVVNGLSLPLPQLVDGFGGLVCESVGKADLLSDHFEGTQSRESVDLLPTCHPSTRITIFAFRSCEVRYSIGIIIELLIIDPTKSGSRFSTVWSSCTALENTLLYFSL